MKVLLVGLGNAGRRHLNLLDKYFDHEVYLFRSAVHPVQLDPVVNHPTLTTWDQVSDVKPKVALICNPTPMHINSALECASRGMHLFIEKPFRLFGQSSRDLQQIVSEKSLATFVAYPFRFHPTVRMLRNARLHNKVATIQCFTQFKNWPKRKSGDPDIGDGVLLELSHEVDYAVNIFGGIRRIDYVGDDTRASVKIFHHGSNLSTVTLDLDCPLERRVMMIGDREYRMNVDETTYLRQMKYFFTNLHNTMMTNNIFDAEVLSGLMEMAHG